MASSPNAGQYGWTNYETAHYNQMIEYVGIAQEAKQTSVDAATYTTKILELEIKPAASSVSESENRVTRSIAEFNISYTDFSSKYDDFVSKYNATTPVFGEFTFSNGWGNYSDDFDKVTCYKQGSLVFLKGLIKRDPGSTENVIGVLPDGFRPSAHKVLGLVGDEKLMRVDILPSGELRIVSFGGADVSNWVSFENLSFLI